MDSFYKSPAYWWLLVILWLIIVSALIRWWDYSRVTDVMMGFALGYITTRYLSARGW